MDSRYYYESYNPGYGDAGFPVSDADYHPLDRHPDIPISLAVVPPTPYAAVWDHGLRQTPGTFHMTSSADPTSPYESGGDYSLIGSQSVEIYSEPTGIYPAQAQPFRPSYTEKAIQTSDPDTASGSEGEESPQVHNYPTIRKLLPQETFKSSRQQMEFKGSQVIEFSVNGEKGLCLSDALEENWAGFEGRDDRSLFGDERLQIIVRLHVIGCLQLQSKVYTTDYTARRRPITRMKLASELAKIVRKFFARERADGHGGDLSRCVWKDTLLKNVYLTRLVRVSAASWQPEIFVELPPAATAPASSSSSS